MKKPYLSKTLWVNAIVAVAAFFPAVSGKLDAASVAMLMAVVNMGLRLVTKDAVSLDD